MDNLHLSLNQLKIKAGKKNDVPLPKSTATQQHLLTLFLKIHLKQFAVATTIVSLSLAEQADPFPPIVLCAVVHVLLAFLLHNLFKLNERNVKY